MTGLWCILSQELSLLTFTGIMFILSFTTYIFEIPIRIGDVPILVEARQWCLVAAMTWRCACEPMYTRGYVLFLQTGNMGCWSVLRSVDPSEFTAFFVQLIKHVPLACLNCSSCCQTCPHPLGPLLIIFFSSSKCQLE